jgi:hypothetical protein
MERAMTFGTVMITDRHFGSADDISAKSRANTQTDKEIADLGNIYRALPKYR